MLQNYLKIAFRNLLKHKAFSLINISGLAIGLTCCILILLYIQDELSYDTYHENADRIVRLERYAWNGDSYRGVPVSSHPYGPALKQDYPEVLDFVRFYPAEVPVKDQRQQYIDETILFADQQVFDVFTWPLSQGDASTALAEPSSVVLTESAAERYFGTTAAINKTLSISQGDTDLNLKVTGILQEIPQNSHFHFDVMVSYQTLAELVGRQAMTSWLNNYIYTYLLLDTPGSGKKIEAIYPTFYEKYMGAETRAMHGENVDIASQYKLGLKPITDIHLKSQLEHEIEPTGSMATVYTFSAIALLILLIACINFMNLSTARSLERANEVGLRKVVGANRQLLVSQFLGESTLLSLFALLASVGIIELLIPLFNNLTGKTLALDYFEHPEYAAMFFGLALFVGLLAGSYPALALSGFQPSAIFRGKMKMSTAGAFLRKGLVVFQFAISIALICGTLVVQQQLDFIKQQELGFEKQQVVVLPIKDGNFAQKHAALKNGLLSIPGVKKAGLSSRIPSDLRFGDTMFAKDGSTQEEDMHNIRYFSAGHDFLSTLEVDFVTGRDFSPAFATDSTAAFILNEAAVKRMGWQSSQAALGKRFARATNFSPLQFQEGFVIGVVRDFHLKSLHEEIEPFVIIMNTADNMSYISLRVSPDNMGTTIEGIENQMKKFSPAFPFEYFFLDDNFDQLYRADERLQEIFSYFTFVAILIACLGLLGLAAYSAEQRAKEIGVRKVLGASIANITFLLSREFIKWVVLANILAWPFAYYFMQGWLQEFAYRINLGPVPFVLAAGLAFLISLLTVSYQAIKASLANPIESLKHE